MHKHIYKTETESQIWKQKYMVTKGETWGKEG